MDTLWNRKRKKRKKEIRTKKEINNRLIKDVTVREIKTLFKQEEKEDNYKLKKASNFTYNSYIEYESNGDRNRSLSLDNYLYKIEP